MGRENKMIIVFKTDGMSQEDKDFEDRRDKIIAEFKGGHTTKEDAFGRLKGIGLSDDVAREDLT